MSALAHPASGADFTAAADDGMDPASPAVAQLLRRAAQGSGLDAAARQAVAQAVQDRPDAVYGLAAEALRLQSELAASRHLVERLKRMHPAPATHSGPTAEELKRQSAAWDALLGTGSRRRTSGEAPAKAPRVRTKTFEDVGARFFADHVGKVWAFLIVISAVVVLVKERIV